MSRATVIRLAITGCVVALVAPLPLTRTYLTPLTWYWAVNWDHGFVRRGLSGEIAQRLAPHDLHGAAQTLTGLAAVVAGGLFLAVGVWLVCRLDPVSVGVGLTLILSPVGMVYQWNEPHPESYGYLALIPLAAALRSSGRLRDALVVLSGVILGVVTLMSENVLFAVVPWAILFTLAMTDAARRSEAVRMLALLLPLPALMGALVIVGGRASQGQLQALKRGAPGVSRTAVHSMHYIGDSYSSNAHFVMSTHLRLSFEELGATLVAVGVAVGAACLVGNLGVVRRLAWDRWLKLACFLPLVGYLIQTVGGIDWPRWVGQQASGASLLIGLIWLLRPDIAPPSWSKRRVVATVVGVSLLVAIPPVHYQLTRAHVVDYWFSRITEL